VLDWALSHAQEAGLGDVLSVLCDRIEYPLTQISQWIEVYLAHRSAGHSAVWFLDWLSHGGLPLTTLAPSLVGRLLQSPDRPVREYAIRTMAHGRSPQTQSAPDGSAPRPLLP